MRECVPERPRTDGSLMWWMGGTICMQVESSEGYLKPLDGETSAPRGYHAHGPGSAVKLASRDSAQKARTCAPPNAN
jgi:hypothetical protein